MAAQIPPPPSKGATASASTPHRQHSNSGSGPALLSSTTLHLQQPLQPTPAPLHVLTHSDPSTPSTSGNTLPFFNASPRPKVAIPVAETEADAPDLLQSESSDESTEGEGEDADSDAELGDQFVTGGDALSVSKISNRSSPSVLSATIHQWPGYEEESHGLLDNNEDSDVDNDSENEDPDDPWKILPEQRSWYINLFLRLQPDIHGYIEGRDARVFFENSQLPLQDLGEIWNCSDVDRDGKLTLAEFCYAMHLSLARRHGLNLPSHIPISLKNSARNICKTAESMQMASPASRPQLSAGDHIHQPGQWTKFSESPRNRPVAPAGPVQFRNTIDSEQLVAQPLATRVDASPANVASYGRDGRSYSTASTNNEQQSSDSAVIAPPLPPRSFHSRSASLDLQGSQPPQPHKANITLQPSSNTSSGTGTTTAFPPQLPPRSSPIFAKRLDSATGSDSDSENRFSSHFATSTGVPTSSAGSHGALEGSRPEKPPRTGRTPNKNVTFSGGGMAPSDGLPSNGWDNSMAMQTAQHHSHSTAYYSASQVELPALIDLAISGLPSSQDLDKLKTEQVWQLIQRLRTVVEALSRQNTDLQQQLTEVVLKKRTTEVLLSNTDKDTQLQRGINTDRHVHPK